jgi:LmbE family N-acetylglucosaminyl deacetylase
MRVLGVEEHRWLGFQDGGLPEVDPEVGVGCVEDLLDEVAPDTVVTFGADGMTFHPDHMTVHAWVVEAWRRRGSGPRLLFAALEVEAQRRYADVLESWGAYMTDERPVPVPAEALALHLRLDDALLDRKVAALTAMPSQVAPSLAVLSEADFRMVNSEEAFVTAVSGDGG